VPAFYLRHWADDGKLRVTDIDRRHSYVTTSEKAARETDFHSLAGGCTAVSWAVMAWASWAMLPAGWPLAGDRRIVLQVGCPGLAG
jgi:hypothetical protein